MQTIGSPSTTDGERKRFGWVTLQQGEEGILVLKSQQSCISKPLNFAAVFNRKKGVGIQEIVGTMGRIRMMQDLHFNADRA